MAIKFNLEEKLEYELEVSDMLMLEKEKVSLFNSKGMDIYLSYCGMPSDKVFSLAYEQDDSSKNIYFPVDTKEIGPFADKKFEVLEVNPEKIKLRYLGKK